MRLATTPAQALAAVTDPTAIADWWTSVTASERCGDEVRLTMGGQVLAFTVAVSPTAGRVTWTVTRCEMIADWVGTRPTFHIRPAPGGETEVEFHHDGLNPTLDCYDACRAGWNHFMPSLHIYLETGRGLPNHPRLAPA